MKRERTKYAVIDIETTGGMSKRDKITEIAIVLYDGFQIIDQFDTLINPERSIPFEITRITGITNDMVRDAPKFYEVAKKVVEMTEGAIFVAHNVRFDYGFIQEEFSKLGYTFTRKKLCTVRMSRKAFPGLRSYSLGNLIKHFGISVNARHRALDDTLATVELFRNILHHSNHSDEIDVMIKRSLKEQKFPEAITPELVNKLPEEIGVYYFYDSNGQVIYVGKSVNIRSRIKQHFTKITSKSTRLISRAHGITYEKTGHELIALLKESEEIKELRPSINKAQKNELYPYFSFAELDDNGFLNLHIEKSTVKNRSGKGIISEYKSLSGAKSSIGKYRGAFQLCESKISVKGKVNSKCIYHALGECYGACLGMENSEDYNERVKLAIRSMTKMFDSDFLIKVEGRTETEKTFVLIRKGRYQGYGFVSEEIINEGMDSILGCISKKRKNVESNSLIAHYLESNTDYDIIYLSE